MAVQTPRSIFICHSSKDKFFVRTLAARLEEAGVRAWVDEAEISIGDSLSNKIGEAILKTDYVGIVLSQNSIGSEWVQRELQVALQREISERKVVVLPILLQRVEIPPFLRDKLYADFTSVSNFEETFPRLLEVLGVGTKFILPEGPPPSEPVLRPMQQKLAEFVDITIVDLDTNKSYVPDPGVGLYNMYLKLSRGPSEEWQQIFDAERSFPRHSMWRRAWIEGDYIVVYCVPEELERYHLRDLREDVEKSNMRYRGYLFDEVQRETRSASLQKRERDDLSDLKKRLGF